ncbi:MAG: hypothetical protein LBG95_07000 [Treponema sp.]|jgi:hypothetical protein|nr:hypothetical protein [Treponema sp.]
MDAASIARERLEQYLDEALKGEWPDTRWEFFTFLLEQAQSHPLDRSGYASLAQQNDAAEAMRRNKENEPQQGQTRTCGRRR